MNKIIFLDFNGVLTTAKSQYRIDKEKLQLLDKILKATEAKIVISSTWKELDFEETKKYILEKEPMLPFAEYIIDQTDNIPIILERAQKGVEIQRWINRHNVENYVILDDETDMLYCQKDNFINTDTYNGLSEEDVKKAIEILNK